MSTLVREEESIASRASSRHRIDLPFTFNLIRARTYQINTMVREELIFKLGLAGSSRGQSVYVCLIYSEDYLSSRAMGI